MRSVLAVPKKNPVEEYGGGAFCFVREALPAFAARTAGKLLIVADGAAFPFVAFWKGPRTLTLVLEGDDALPLFASGDGVGAVFAAGGEAVMRAARLYAAVCRIPCMLAPSDGALFGILEGEGGAAGGVRGKYPLAESELVLDMGLLSPSLGEAYCRLLLARLALFESRAKAMLSLGNSEFADEMFAALSVLGGEAEGRDIVRANLALRALEERGAPCGEGAVLASSYAVPDALRAFCELYALYSAFFLRGRPRRYFVPDYSARALRAGVPPSSPPTGEEYARRAMALERRRADLVREAEAIGRKRAVYLRTAAMLGKRYVPSGERSALRSLPERCPEGLSALIRDFGLMEWD